MAFVIILSRYVLIPILTEWLNDKDFGSLDSALCNARFRSILIELVRSHTTAFQGMMFSSLKWYPLSTSIMDWCDERHFPFYFSNIIISLENLEHWTYSERMSVLQRLLAGCRCLRLCRITPKFLYFLKTVIPSFVTLTELEYSGLYGPTNFDPESFKHCNNLQKCDLTLCQAVDWESAVALCRNCPLLSDLILFRCSKVDDRVLHAVVVHCKRLQLLDVNYCHSVSARAVSLLSLMYNRCGGNFELRVHHTNESVRGYLWNNTKLTRLTGQTQLYNNGIAEVISMACVQLTYLSLERCTRITDEGMYLLVTSCTLLRVLDIQSLKIIRDQTLSNICQYCHSLEELRLYENHGLTRNGLRMIGSGALCNLTSLTMKALPFTDEDLDIIVNNCSKLRYLDISANMRYTAEGLCRLGPQLQRLTTLSIKYCPSLHDSIDLIKLHCGNVVA